MKKCSLKNQIYVRFLILSVIPLILLGIISYIKVASISNEKRGQKDYLILEKMTESVENEISLEENQLQKLCSDKKLCELLRTTDFSSNDTDVMKAYKEIDNIVLHYFSDNKFYEGIMFLDKNNNPYMHKLYLNNEHIENISTKFTQRDKISKTVYYQRVPNYYGSGKYTNLFLLRKSVFDLNFKSDGAYLATVCLFLNENIFSKCFHVENNRDNLICMLYDTNGRLVVGNSKNIKNAWEYGRSFYNEIFSKKKNWFTYDIDNDSCIVSYYTSKMTNWKLVTYVSKKVYMSDTRFIAFFSIFLQVIFIAVILVLIVYTVKKIFGPVDYIVNLMQNADKTGIEKVEKYDGKYAEIETIVDGYNLMRKKIIQLIHEVSDEKKKQAETALRCYRYQINPHFLYNTLGAINIMALNSGNKTVSKMIAALSRLLRRTLVHGTGLITVYDEFQNICEYMEIQQMLYENRIDFSYEYGGCENALLPPMLLQPLVENSIRHGLNKKLYNNERAILNVSAKKSENDLIITIYDNGCGIDEALKSRLLSIDNTKDFGENFHIGISNVLSRVKQQYGDKCGISIESEEGGYTCLVITLPFEENYEKN